MSARAVTLAPPEDISRMAFLAGHWRGGTGDVVIEEMWLAPAAGLAQGSVRLVENGRVGTIELVLVTAERDRVVMRYNHFQPDYRPWETDGPILLTLTPGGDDEVIFRNVETPPRHALELGYRRRGADAMSSWVIVPRDDGSTARFAFDFTRAAQPS